jgi:hypothetical protein
LNFCPAGDDAAGKSTIAMAVEQELFRMIEELGSSCVRDRASVAAQTTGNGELDPKGAPTAL